jgi:hypothetical protein
MSHKILMKGGDSFQKRNDFAQFSLNIFDEEVLEQ